MNVYIRNTRSKTSLIGMHDELNLEISTLNKDQPILNSTEQSRNTLVVQYDYFPGHHSVKSIRE